MIFFFLILPLGNEYRKRRQYSHSFGQKRSGKRNYGESCYFPIGFQQIQNQAADLGLYFLKDSLG